MPPRIPGRGLSVVVAVAVTAAMTLAGCQFADPGPAPVPSGSATPRPFTVMSTDPVRVADPAAITDAASAIVALNVFQRLMTAAPGQSVLKPDAARDCLFTSATTYSCTLNDGLTFHNGHALTSSDVKFSLERATRLDVDGSSAPLLSSLRRIETPDPLTVRFLLSRPDTQFGWALASPAASIVDEELYDTDEIRPRSEPIIGSGPFRVTAPDAANLDFTRYAAYTGFHPAAIDAVRYQVVADSATIEDAMSKGQVEVVWRGLNSAAVTRYATQVARSSDGMTTDGFAMQVKSGLRVRELIWAPRSPLRANRRVRQAIAVALQGDRTLASLVPDGVPGHAPSFPLGGRATPKVTWKDRIQLTLTYDAAAPDARDIATQIRTRLEDTGGLSVRLQPDQAVADLALVDRKAWTATALAWLQPYLEHPLPASASKIADLEAEFRATTDPRTAQERLGDLQSRAARDLTVLPVTQGDEPLFVRRGAEVGEQSFGPGWQLGLFGMRRA